MNEFHKKEFAQALNIAESSISASEDAMRIVIFEDFNSDLLDDALEFLPKNPSSGKYCRVIQVLDRSPHYLRNLSFEELWKESWNYCICTIRLS